MLFTAVNTFGQCVTVNSSVISLASKSGSPPNQMCTYNFTPNVTVASSGTQPKLLQFTMSAGGVTKYICYTSPNGTTISVTVQTTACGAVNDKLPRTTSDYPTATFTLPCGTGTGVYNGYAGASTGGGTGECTPSTTIPFSGPLPVKLISFDAIKTANGTSLKWETATETNSKSFVIQQSKDTKTFEDIGEVETAGNSDINQSYNFMINDVNAGTTYFRLKQVDWDGKFVFSKIISVVNETATEAIVLFPNPTTGKQFSVEGISDKVVSTELLTMQGGKSSVTFSQTGTTLNLTLPSAPSNGIYFLKIKTQGAELMKKIIIE